MIYSFLHSDTCQWWDRNSFSNFFLKLKSRLSCITCEAFLCKTRNFILIIFTSGSKGVGEWTMTLTRSNLPDLKISATLFQKKKRKEKENISGKTNLFPTRKILSSKLNPPLCVITPPIPHWGIVFITRSLHQHRTLHNAVNSRILNIFT